MWDTVMIGLATALRKPAAMNAKLTLTVLPEEVSICRLNADEAIPEWATNNVFSAEES